MVSIVGAGPAGLAIAGRLTKAGIACKLYEKSKEIGHSWHHHYDRLHLHTIKEFSHLPHLPFSGDYPQYVSREQFVKYLEEYARHFQLEIELGREVSAINPSQNRWQIEFKDSKETVDSEIVIVATGYNQHPVEPVWPGMEHFAGTIIHSKHYKNPEPFFGKKVLIVGMGNTGAEVALDLANYGIHVTISIRGPVNIVPRDFRGRPTQKTAMLLRKLPHWLGDRIGILLRRIAIGDLSAYGIETPKDPPAAQLRKHGKTPVIDLGTVDLIKQGKIRIASGIKLIGERKVTFQNGESEAFDSIILATGYKAGLQQWVHIDQNCFDHKGAPRQAYFKEYSGLYFLGFDTSFSGILNAIYEQSEMIFNQIQKQITASES